MTSDQKKIEELKEVLKKIEYIEYEDPDDGFQMFCPICGARPKPERLSRGQREALSHLPPGRGHHDDCELAKAIRE